MAYSIRLPQKVSSYHWLPMYYIPLRIGSLLYNLSNREDAHLFEAAYTREPSKDNFKKCIEYDTEHLNKPLLGFWNGIFFTDEAHFNLTDDFHRPHILRRYGERLAPSNNITRPNKKSSPHSVHLQ